MVKVQIKLVYEDSSEWFAGEFDSLEEANRWINEEKTRPYWDNSTVVNINEINIPEEINENIK